MARRVVHEVVVSESQFESMTASDDDSEYEVEQSERGLLKRSDATRSGRHSSSHEEDTRWAAGRARWLLLPALLLLLLVVLLFAFRMHATSSSSMPGPWLAARSSGRYMSSVLPTLASLFPFSLLLSSFGSSSSLSLPYRPYHGLLRGVSFSQYPYLVSGRVVTSSSISGYSYHPDFNRFIYRDKGRSSIANVPAGVDRDSLPRLMNTMVMGERDDGPGCINSGFSVHCRL